MNGYISDKLTFSNALLTSPKYPRKLESFKVVGSDAHYFMDDLFQMILLNLHHMEKVQIRIIGSQYNNNEDWNNKSIDNLYYSYHHKQFKKQRFLLSYIKEELHGNYFREFYVARVKYGSLKQALSNEDFYI